MATNTTGSPLYATETASNYRELADELAALNTAISQLADDATLTLEGRPYWLSGPVVVPCGKSGITIQGTAGTQFVWTTAGGSDALYGVKVGMGTGSSLGIDDAETPTKRTTLDDNVTLIYTATAPSRGDTSIVLDDTITTPPAEGDIWILYDLNQGLDIDNGPTTTGTKTFLFKVGAYTVGTKTITIDEASGAVPHTFSGTVNCAKLTGEATYGACENITIDGIKFDCVARDTFAKQKWIVQAQNVHGLTISNCSFDGASTGALNIAACTDVTVEDCSATRLATTGAGLGVAFWFHGCTDVTVTSPVVDTCRHAVEFTDGCARCRVTDGVCTNQDATGSAWDTHGCLSYDIEFVRCTGGFGHAGNATYILGDDLVVFTDCVLDAVKVHGDTVKCSLDGCTLSQGVFANAYIYDGTKYSPVEVDIAGCTLGNFSDGGCIRVSATGTGATAELETLSVTDCRIESTEAASDYSPFVDVYNNVLAGTTTITVTGNTISAPNRTDAKPVIRLWGTDAVMSYGDLQMEVSDNKIVAKGCKLLHLRSTGTVTAGTVAVEDNRLWSGCTAATKAGATDDWNEGATLTFDGNVLEPF